MVNTLDFNTGVVKFSVNGKAEVAFNPTDILFLKRLFGTAEALDDLQKRSEEERANLATPEEIFAHAVERDENAAEIIDGLFGEGFSEAAFEGVSAFAAADGFPICLNLICAVIDKFDDSMIAEQKKTNPRLEKYLAKYRKK